jgi:type IV pilus assembly protein PilV
MRLTPRPPGSGASSEDGFTLLEIIVAMGILAVGLLAIAAAQLSALRLSRHSRYLTSSMNLAQQQMELFQMTPNASLPANGTYNDPLNPIDIDPNDNDVSVFNRRWTITRDSPLAGVTTIRIAVDWVDERGLTRTTALESMKGL